MANFFIYILISSVMCSLCGLSVLLLNRLAKGVSQRFKCSILTLSVIVPYFGVFAAPFFPKAETVHEKTAVSVESEYREYAVTGYVSEEMSVTPVVEEQQTFPMIFIDIIVIAAWVWCAVAAFMLTYSIARHIRLSLILRKQRQLMSNSGTLRIYTVSMQISPFISGFFKPVIYIPYGTYSSDELELAVAHETAHYKRGDLYRRLLITILNCVNWFNPAYRFVLKKLIQQTEYACDETVINTLGKDSDKRYGYMLLKTAEKGSKNGVLGVGLGSDAENLKRRIEMIMNNNRKTSRNARAVTIGAFVLSAVLCIGGCRAISSVAVVGAGQTENKFQSKYKFEYSNCEVTYGGTDEEFDENEARIKELHEKGYVINCPTFENLSGNVSEDEMKVYAALNDVTLGYANEVAKTYNNFAELGYAVDFLGEEGDILNVSFIGYGYPDGEDGYPVPLDRDYVCSIRDISGDAPPQLTIETGEIIYPNEELKIGRYYLNGDPSTGQYIDITENFGFQYVGFDFFGQHMESEKDRLDSLDEDEREQTIASIREYDESREKKRFYQIQPRFGNIIVKDFPTYQPSLGGEAIDRIDENTLEFDKDHIYIYVG